MPEILLSLPGKGGVLWLGIRSGDAAKWLSEAERIVSRYRGGGAMQYEIADGLLGPGRLTIDVVPRPENEGVVVRVTPSENVRPVELIWTFGGATGYTAWSLDTCGYCPESTFWLKPEDCEQHAFKIDPAGFELHSPGYKDPPVGRHGAARFEPKDCRRRPAWFAPKPAGVAGGQAKR